MAAILSCGVAVGLLFGCANGQPPSAETAASSGASPTMVSASAPTGTGVVGPIDHPARWDSAVEIAPPPPEVQSETSVEIEIVDELDVGEELTFPGDLLFTPDSDVLAAEAEPLFVDFAAKAVAQLTADENIVAHGWVDTQGDPSHNFDLANRRALAVASRILRLAPQLEGRVFAVGHGEDDLLDPSCIGDCPANRAVTIAIEAATS